MGASILVITSKWVLNYGRSVPASVGSLPPLPWWLAGPRRIVVPGLELALPCSLAKPLPPPFCYPASTRPTKGDAVAHRVHAPGDPCRGSALRRPSCLRPEQPPSCSWSITRELPRCLPLSLVSPPVPFSLRCGAPPRAHTSPLPFQQPPGLCLLRFSPIRMFSQSTPQLLYNLA